MAGRGQRAQDLRELVRGELAGSTRAVAELREAAGGASGVDPCSSHPTAVRYCRRWIRAGVSSPHPHTVLADPRLADATARLGRERVKAAVASAQQAVREGALAAADVVDAALDALPAHRDHAAPRPQRHRRAAAHEPRAGPAVGRGPRRARRRGGHVRRRAGPRHRRARPARRGRDRRPARRGARRRGRARGEQRRRRARARRAHAGAGPGDGRRPRRARGDRRRLPHPRAAGGDRGPAARGRHHQPGHPRPTTPRPSARTPRSC